MNNNRGGQNQNHQRKYTDPTNHSQFAHSAVPVSNPSGYIISGQRGLRQYLNAAPHNVSDMKNNHMPNMTHGQIQMVQTHIPPRQQQALPHHLRPNAPRNLPRGPIQYQVYLPNNVYQGSSNPTAFYQYNPQQGSPAVIMPFIQNYSTNQAASMYYSTTQRPLQMANIPQGPQNPSVANMSNVQNSHGPLIVQPQPVEMASNTQSLQVTQPPSTASMQPSEPRPQKRRNAALKIIDPNTGNEIDLNNTQALPSADELEKMKVQSQFQSLVQSVVKKDDAKVSDNQSNEGGEKVRNEFQSQVKKLLDEEASIPSKPIEVNEAQLPDETLINPSILPKNEEITAPIINSTVEDNSVVTIDLSVSSIEKSEEVLTVNENNTEISLPTTAVPILVQEEISQITTDSVTIIPEEVIAKKITDEESSKPAKPKKSKGKKKKSTVKENEETINIVPPSVPEVIKLESANNTHENKENENDNHNLKIEGEEAIKKSEEILQQPTDTQDICVQPEVVIKKIPKLPSYLKNLPYEEGQWSITNTTGKKRYSKLFLTQLGSEAVCQKKPDVLKTWGSITKSSSSPQFSSLGGISNLPRSQSASASSTFLPSYFKPGNNSQRGSLMTGVKRNSSQGKTASKTSKPNTIHMSLSLREEVKLNQTENAWVPTAAKKATKVEVKNKNEEELTTEDVNKSVRSILNKITPDNMIPLTERFKALPIDSYERLTKTIDLVFEKAIEEQSFAPLYASLCHAMQNVQVSSGEGNKISFKKLIISKCQSLFELDKAQEMDSAKKLAEINSCKDPENKKELQIIYDENERRLRKRSVGNCRFIGELFKQKILTPNIMLYCIVNLVTKHEEEPLECLCNLLKTVGKELEQSFGLAETFDKLQALTSKEMKSKIPSRIRFMIQDVIDLRRDKWIPRRNDSKPKLINEIENDAKNEAIEQSMARESYRPEKPRDRDRDHHRGDDNKFRGGDNKSRRGNDNEWNIVHNTKYKQQNYTIDQSKLQGFKESSSVTTLGPSSKWSFSNSSGGSKSSTFSSTNTYTALNDDKKLSTSQMMSNKNTSRKPVILESEERKRMISGVKSMMPQFAQTTLNATPPISQTAKEPVEEPVNELDPDEINMLCKNIILEYEQMHNLHDIIFLLEKESFFHLRHEDFVKSLSLISFDCNRNSPTVAGRIFAELLSKKVLSLTAVTQGIDAVLKDWNDYLMDYPQFFSYIAAIIAPLLISKTASFEFINLKDACASIRPNNSSELFTEVLQQILSSKETQNIKEHVGGILWVYNKWRTSEYVPLDAFMPTNMVNKYFKKDRVGVFLLSIALYDKMKSTDGKLIFDKISSWISTNIYADVIKCPQFVRALTIAIVIVCLKPNQSFDNFFEHVHIKLMTCFIRSEPLPVLEIQAREVECLYGIQLMSAMLEHPGGMVLKLFHKLYQDSVISKDAFEKWKKEEEFKSGFDEDLETKTMAVVVLNSFFLSLATNDSDDDETGDQ